MEMVWKNIFPMGNNNTVLYSQIMVELSHTFTLTGNY